jgi:isoleucyl-tRNA synthetase
MTQTQSPPEPRDYRETLFLPKTDFPMRAGLPKKEPEIQAQWDRIGLYKRLREASKGSTKFILHDGPPYANGHLHIGHALNKILKDVITRSQQMMGFDSNYVPGWDCHGLPIEWKIEEQYRAKGKNKDEIPINEFRQECREFAAKWVGIQSEEFQRLGVIGDFENPYLTMSFDAEAIIAEELMKFAKSGQLYRGSKPIMWSVVERTALAEAEIEYHTYESDTIWVKFPVLGFHESSTSMLTAMLNPDVENDGEGSEIVRQRMEDLKSASVVIWTTTPWTIPGNRSICFSDRISYGLYEVVAAENDFGPQPGEKLIFADALAEESATKAKVTFNRLWDVLDYLLEAITCAHPLAGFNDYYSFPIPLLQGDHVTDEAGTGFVHTAPGHGRDDFEIWLSSANDIESRGISTDIPFTVGADGAFTEDAPGFTGERVIDDKGKKGKANQVVITALIAQNNLFARGRLKHDYPHSWRSKKPIIFRNTPQWFVYMDKDIEGKADDTLRVRALQAIDNTRFVPKGGQVRLRGMIETRPDWVLSRQRAWGVPIAVFVDDDGNILKDETVNARIVAAFKAEGADAWYADGAAERFLEGVADSDKWQQVTDILDVWFDSGSTHAFCMEQREDLTTKNKRLGGPDTVMYLEGTDQHRGWFHSSLLESCGTRGHAPYDIVLTHGFTMAEDGRKMSKSLNNQVAPQDVIKQSGADILRLWVMSTDYVEDQRIGAEILKNNVDAYRKLRNTLRYMIGALEGFDKSEIVDVAEMPELERYILHSLAELDQQVRDAYNNFDFKRGVSALLNFMNLDLSAFYFDIRKDVLYCDMPTSNRRRACRTVMDQVFHCMVKWLAPMLCFTMEEVWQTRFPDENDSVHLKQFPEIPAQWRNDALARKWAKIRELRSVVTGALEIERREKRIGSSLEAAPLVYVTDETYIEAMQGIDLAEISITSQATLMREEGPEHAFRLPNIANISVVPALATGNKCQRSWKILPEVGSDPEYPDLSSRDAEAVRSFDSLK